MLLANAFAQQQAGRFPSRAPADVAWRESELLASVRQSEGSLAGGIGSTDSFLEQLQDFLDQAEPENGVLDLEQPAQASQNHGGWCGEVASPVVPAAAPAHGTGQPAPRTVTKSAPIAKPAGAGGSPSAGLYPAAGTVSPGGIRDHRWSVDAPEAAAQAPVRRQPQAPRKARSTRAAAWRYALVAVLAGSVLGLAVARLQGKAGSLWPGAARPQAKPQAAALSATPVLQPASGPVRISDITSSSGARSAQVRVDLQGPVTYRAYRLHNPERLYFDLQNADLAPPLLGRSVALDGGLVRKIRSAQRGPDVSRVTLETDGRCKYQASILPDPYRLIIQVQQRPSARK